MSIYRGMVDSVWGVWCSKHKRVSITGRCAECEAEGKGKTGTK